MRIFVTGVSCVGKTTIGAQAARLLGCAFFDLDQEIERFHGKPIAAIQSEHMTVRSYREVGAAVLRDLVERTDGTPCVIALPPSGLMNGYWRAVKKARATTVVLTDTPENILARITFTDDESRRIEKRITEKEKRHYLREIRQDMTYFGRSYGKADVSVHIAGLDPCAAAAKVAKALSLTGGAEGMETSASG